MRRPIRGAIRVRRRAIGIRRRTVRVWILRMRRLRLRLCLRLGRTVCMRSGIARRVRLLRPATSRHRGNTDCHKCQQTELDSVAHLYSGVRPSCFSLLHRLLLLFLLLRLGIIRIVVRFSGQVFQRLEIREHIVIFEHRQVLQHLSIGLLHIHRWEC